MWRLNSPYGTTLEAYLSLSLKGPIGLKVKQGSQGNTQANLLLYGVKQNHGTVGPALFVWNSTRGGLRTWTASPKLSGSLSTNKQNKSLIVSVERYKSLTLLNLCGLSLELSPELELSSKVFSWIGVGEGGGVMFCGRSTTCGKVASCSSTKYGKKS
ncbi:hypothetical protein V6N12_005889 [Hibiscus sabdariffa]|uniref:Uncharacterized protein n=1 Tax=Hibiscus sabdariffa TaxID=183260 RepID=A0ABR2EY22_9ROSI